MNPRFIYDEATSSLFAPNGTFLKKVFCPRAMRWNQLVVEDGEDRWRGCNQCEAKVINLDLAATEAVVDECSQRGSDVCVYASSASDNVVFLKDPKAPPPGAAPELNDAGLIIIRTARTFDDINRAVGLGYWPDVRFVQYDTQTFREVLSIGQDPTSGRIDLSGDFRRRFGPNVHVRYPSESQQADARLKEVIPFTGYYPYFQETPIAAYLIPKDLRDGSRVIVADPIEDLVGGRWQDSAFRARDVAGCIVDRRVVIDEDSIKIQKILG